MVRQGPGKEILTRAFAAAGWALWRVVRAARRPFRPRVIVHDKPWWIAKAEREEARERRKVRRKRRG